MMKVRPVIFRIIGTLLSFKEWEDKDFLFIGDGRHTKCENGFHVHALKSIADSTLKCLYFHARIDHQTICLVSAFTVTDTETETCTETQVYRI